MYDCLINDVMCVIIRIVVIVNTACCDSCTIVIIVILNTYVTQQLATRMAEVTAIARVYGHFQPQRGQLVCLCQKTAIVLSRKRDKRRQEGRCSDNHYRHQSLQFAAKHTHITKSR